MPANQQARIDPIIRVRAGFLLVMHSDWLACTLEVHAGVSVNSSINVLYRYWERLSNRSPQCILAIALWDCAIVNNPSSVTPQTEYPFCFHLREATGKRLRGDR